MAFMVPFHRDDMIIDRATIFSQIDRGLETHDFVALTGPGGIGKTHASIEYCFRFRENHPQGLVILMFASSPTRLHQCLTEISRKLNIPSQTKSLLLDLLNWLYSCQYPEWLLVLDGVVFAPQGSTISDDVPASTARTDQSFLEELWSEYSSRATRGKIVITAEELDLNEIPKLAISPVVIPPWTAKEAKSLLQSKLSMHLWDEHSTTRIIELLGYHPLAISLAASYMATNGCSAELYLTALLALYSDEQPYHKSKLSKLMSTTPPGLCYSLSISFAQLKKENLRASELLFLASTLDIQGMPKSLFYREGEVPRVFKAAMRALKSLSLVAEDTQGENLFIHDCIKFWTRCMLESGNNWLVWNAQAVHLLAGRFRYAGFHLSRNCSFLNPHVEAVLGRNMTAEFCLECSQEYKRDRGTLLQSTASYFESRGLYSISYKKLEEALSIFRKLEPSWKTYKTIIEISKTEARILCNLKNYDEAEKVLKWVLKAKFQGQELDEEDVGLLNIYNALARIAHERADYQTAETYYEKALEANINDHYEDHVDSLIIKSNLAGLKMDKGDYAKASKMIREVLEARQTLWGLDHPDTLQSMSDLSVILKAQGDLTGAEKLCKEALEIAKRVQGAEHPDTLTVYGNLARVLSARGKYQEAVSMQRRLLISKEAAFGSSHQFLIPVRQNLAVDLEKMGQYAEAEEVFRTIMVQAETTFGKDHPTTLKTTNGLGLVLLRQGKFKEAEPMLRHVLEMKIEFYKGMHQETLVSMNNLAGCLQRQGKFLEAEQLHRKTFAESKTVLGEKHPFTLRSQNNVAEVLRDQGDGDREKLGEAEKLQREALAGREEVLGFDHPDTLTSTFNLARVLRQLGRSKEALPLYERAHNGFDQKLGKDNATAKACVQELSILLSQVTTTG